MNRAREVVAVGRHMNDVLETLQGINEEASNRARDIAKLMETKS